MHDIHETQPRTQETEVEGSEEEDAPKNYDKEKYLH